MAAFCHVALDLPGKLGLVGYVQVDLEVNEVVDTVIVKGVETFNDQNLGGLDFLSWVEETTDVVVDWLLDGLAFLECLDLFVGVWRWVRMDGWMEEIKGRDLRAAAAALSQRGDDGK